MTRLSNSDERWMRRPIGSKVMYVFTSGIYFEGEEVPLRGAPLTFLS